MIWISVAIPWFLENNQEKKEQICAICVSHWIEFFENIEVIKSIDTIKMWINRVLILKDEDLIEKLINNPELLISETNENLQKIINDNYFYERWFIEINQEKFRKELEIRNREKFDSPFIEKWKKERWFSSSQDILRNPKANMWVKSRKQKR